MKNKLYQENKEKIMLHIVALTNKNENIREKAFNFLTDFTINDPTLKEANDIWYLDAYEITTYMLLGITKWLYEDEDYINIMLIKETIHKLEAITGEYIEEMEDLIEFTSINEHFYTEFNKIMK